MPPCPQQGDPAAVAKPNAPTKVLSYIQFQIMVQNNCCWQEQEEQEEEGMSTFYHHHLVHP